MGTHPIVLSESYPMNTNMTGFRYFFENLCILACAMGKSSLSIGRVNGIQLMVINEFKGF